MSDKINVTLSPDRLQVSPGESAETTVTIRNASDVVEAYSGLPQIIVPLVKLELPALEPTG